MAGIFNTLFGGKYPSTEKYEASVNQLNSDYDRFVDYESSSAYKRYQELDHLVHSGDFIKQVEKLKNEKFKDTKEFHAYKDYQSLKKAKDFKRYFKILDSGVIGRYEEITESPDFLEFTNLNQLVTSPEFIEARKEKDFKKSDFFDKWKRYKRLRKDKNIRFHEKIRKSSDFENYNLLKDSDRLKNYLEQDKYFNSESFQNFKQELEDSHRFKKSEEHGLLSEYEEIKKTPEFIWHRKTSAKNPFTEVNKWQLTFKDDFDGTNLDKNKWITGYYWGKALLNDVYVLSNERQFFKDENIELRDSIVRLVTKNEKTKGKVWDAERGFMPADFDYTSAIISTGQSFRQLYGKFEAKVKINPAKPLNHAFWMVSEKLAPQIDIFRFSNKENGFNAGCHSLSDDQTAEYLSKHVNGVTFSKDYYIYSLEWTKDKLTWFINGVQVHEQTQKVPNDPMYIVFSSHLLEQAENIQLPASMEIDWIKCYQKK